MARDRCVLAYSGGMDSTISIPWIRENYGLDVITLTVDLGSGKEIDGVEERAKKAGAIQSVVKDLRSEFISDYAFRGLRAGALYEGVYPLSTALARPLMALHLVKTAEEVGAVAVAHGCTGKGNDQVRFDAAVNTLRAHTEPLRIVTPAREWEMSRDEEKLYAAKAGIDLREVGEGKVYSIDRNMWGQAIEGEDLEDVWREPPEDAFSWTVSPDTAPDEPEKITISFEKGTPVAIGGRRMDGVEITSTLNEVAGRHGVGRIDHLENRLVGIKSREIYETPGASTLFRALAALEASTLARDQQRLKTQLASVYADLVYDGRWFTALRENLDAAVDSIQRYTTGDVRMKFYKGVVTPVGVRADYSLYDYDLATYSTEDAFEHGAATGFIQIYSLPAVIQARRQTMKDAR